MSTPTRWTLSLTRPTADLAVHADQDAPATVGGMVVPWGEEFTRMGGVRFVFDRDQLRLPDDLSTVKLLVQHDDDRPIGYATDATAADDGLHMTFALPDHPRTAAARAELDARLRDGLSVGVEVDQAVVDAAFDVWWDGQQDEPLTMAGTLREVSQVTVPQFNQARVSRHRAPALITAARPDQEDPAMGDTTPTPAADPVADRLAQLASRIDAVEARHTTAAAPAEQLPRLRDVVAQRLAAFAAGPRATLALADVLGSGNSGLLPPQWVSEVVGYLDARRPLFANSGSVPFPSTGYGLTVPKVTQHVQVGARGTEKTQVPTRALTTSTDTYSIKWFAGAVDIALELIAQSDPAVLGLVWDDMLDQYAIATEGSFVTDVEAIAGANFAGAIDFTSYKTFIADVIAASADVRAATGVPGDRVGLTSDSWVELLGLVDGDNRRVLATSGASNADGSALFTAEAVTVGGIGFFHSPQSTVDVMFNTKSLRAAEKPPMQLTSDNVALMGRDVGVLGATIVAPLYPAGVTLFTDES